MFKIDHLANRNAPKWSRREQFVRVLFAFAWPAFRFSPRMLWGWRRWLLRRFGAAIGNHVHIYPTVRIYIPWNLTLRDSCAVGDRVILYALGSIEIGPRAVISQGAHICAGTHDWRDPAMPLQKPPIEIGADAWICADAFVGPGTKVGSGAIIGARAVVTKSIAPGLIVAGNPARKIGERNP